MPITSESETKQGVGGDGDDEAPRDVYTHRPESQSARPEVR